MLVAEGGVYRIRIVGPGLNVSATITAWEARRAGDFLQGDMTNARRTQPPLPQAAAPDEAPELSAAAEWGGEATAVGTQRARRARAETEPGE